MLQLTITKFPPWWFGSKLKREVQFSSHIYYPGIVFCTKDMFSAQRILQQVPVTTVYYYVWVQGIGGVEIEKTSCFLLQPKWRTSCRNFFAPVTDRCSNCWFLPHRRNVEQYKSKKKYRDGTERLTGLSCNWNTRTYLFEKFIRWALFEWLTHTSQRKDTWREPISSGMNFFRK